MHGTAAHGSARPLTTTFEQADFPVTFAGTVGLYHVAPQPSDTAVLFVGAWGLEELCARKFWRLLAADLGRAGISSLRFDYPGTGDALDPQDYSAGLDIWRESILAAAAVLRDLSGAKRLLLVGHSIGAALAWQAAETLRDVAGIALAAPALSGRRWIREFMALSRIADHGAITHVTLPSGPAMGEQHIPDPVLAGIRALDVSKSAKAPAPDMLFLPQEGRATDPVLLERLVSLGAKVRETSFEDYDAFIRDVLLSVPPTTAIGVLAEWAVGLKGDGTAEQRPRPSGTAPLTGDGFRETPVRFGRGQRLYGALCEPEGPPKGAAVIILSTGYDRMSGRGRIGVRICRDLAKAGIPAFRFDFSNIADSPPQPGMPDQILYHPGLERDVGEAADFLEAHGLHPAVLSGRCSGGYTAFRSALHMDGVKAIVAVNPFDFSVGPGADVDALIASVLPFGSYKEKFRNKAYWKQVLRLEIDILKEARHLLRKVSDKMMIKALPLLAHIPPLSRFLNPSERDFDRLAEKGTKISLIYSNGDPVISNLEARLGKRGHLIARYGNAGIVFLDDADHNFSTAHTRGYWLDALVKTASQFKV
ncbi:alpha/beta fold hydrolase [Shinella zoogloeoides]|uniref:alpha/beta fold hydrolase n=1 Tax=Shinella zoogloeoides TaxID=352475 RepID=UPI001F596918|nr:alpha/beta fold hydrolase [Shinella zoogloeoides]